MLISFHFFLGKTDRRLFLRASCLADRSIDVREQNFPSVPGVRVSKFAGETYRGGPEVTREIGKRVSRSCEVDRGGLA